MVRICTRCQTVLQRQHLSMARHTLWINKATMNKAQKKTFVSWGDIAMDEDEEKLIEMHDPLKGDNRCWGDIQMEEDEKNKQEGWTVVKKKSKQ